jgi:hypothetical protein
MSDTPMTPQQGENLSRRKMQTIKDKLHWAEAARIDAEKLIAAGRGGYLRRPTQKLLSALKAIERELV